MFSKTLKHLPTTIYIPYSYLHTYAYTHTRHVKYICNEKGAPLLIIITTAAHFNVSHRSETRLGTGQSRAALVIDRDRILARRLSSDVGIALFYTACIIPDTSCIHIIVVHKYYHIIAVAFIHNPPLACLTKTQRPTLLFFIAVF
jgi:hypothetical protein